MTDERIKEEFEKWCDTGEYTENERVFMDLFETQSNRFKASVFYAGFRAAERLAKIEVLEEVKQFIRMITDESVAGKQKEAYYLACKHFIHEMDNRISDLKGEQ